MNDGRAILEMQEQESNIDFLAAQRQLYSEAKALKRVQAALSIAPPVIVTLLQVFRLIEINLTLFLIVEAALIVSTSVLQEAVNNKCKQAAKIQQAFDSAVYDICFDSADIRPIAIGHLAKKYKKKFGSVDLHYWYSCINESMDSGAAISACQRMNCGWSRRLIRRYAFVSIGLPVLIAVALILAVTILSIDLMTLVFLGTLLEWLVDRVIFTRRCFLSYKGLEDAIAEFDLSSACNIRIIQNRLYEFRCSDYLVPDWFYDLFEQRDERLSAY